MSATAAFAASSSQTPLTTPRLRRLHPFPTSDHRPKAATSAPRYVRFRASPAASWKAVRWRIGVFSSGEGIAGMQQRDLPGEVSFDSLLAAAELFFIMPPSICSIGCVIGFLIPGVSRSFQVNLGSRFFVWQFFFLVGAVAVGGLIRRRQWQRLCRENDSGAGVDLIARIEKVEEDLRSSVTIVRVLSRQLEKLGIKFRVTRKTLKEPISETAALAQKNSEATRALAMQEDNLEKELGEIQKVLLAMQEQQQKQLELILAIGKAGRLFEGKQDGAATEQGPVGRSNPIPQKKQGKQVEIQAGMHSDNDRS